ncbi:MAG: hypothetical protein KDA68_12930 [Planctomycetaceae bacterium]|nr:hypothetical protein [Planctomycetaceae bacterium]
MSDSGLNRREFSRLALAAVGGIAAGCQPQGGSGGGDSLVGTGPKEHLCRGLNECKGLGGGESAGKNACAGQGDCATVEHHSCGGKNTCKGLGGCGASAGMNECKEKGGCAVPLMDDAWKQVRENLEKKMKGANRPIGDAPAKKA